MSDIVWEKEAGGGGGSEGGGGRKGGGGDGGGGSGGGGGGGREEIVGLDETESESMEEEGKALPWRFTSLFRLLAGYLPG